jgi:hypothetical protein
MDFPNRKPLRLKNYDYSAAGYYFVTLCVQDRKNLFEIEDNNIGNDVMSFLFLRKSITEPSPD